MSNRFSMTGKHALVTGGTRGIGLAIAKGFSAAGAQVTIVSRKQENVANALQEWDASAEVLGIPAHVAVAEDRVKLLDQAESQFGPIHVLVNNAGTNPFYGNIADSEEWAWDKTMDVNLKAPYLLSVACGRKMMAMGSGSIVNISSVAGLQASPGQGIYSITKSALIMLTKVLARDLGPHGVRANAILPGLFKTELSRAMWDNDAVLQETLKATSLGRIGDVEELVGAALFLASDAGSYTNGAVLQVDGGLVI